MLEALTLGNLNLALTGKLGKRTLYQENYCAQLTLDLETRNVKLKVNTEVRNDIFSPDAESMEYLEKENIWYKDGPKFLEEQLDKDLSQIDLVLIAAHLH